MRGQPADRAPLLEDSFDEEFSACLQEMGLTFPADRMEEVPVNMEPIPAFKDEPILRAGLKELRARLDPEDPKRLPEDWPKRAKELRNRDGVLRMGIHRGFFLSLGVNDWESFVGVIETVMDEPRLVAEAMELIGDFHARLARRVLRDADVDLATLSEPIAGGGGPLISPRMFREIALESYRPVLAEVRRAGVETVAFVSWADTRVLLPGILEAGIDCLWAYETHGCAMDYLALRREFGRGLKLIGGVDLDNLRLGPAGIDREINEKVVPLLSQGAYAPLADGRIRAGFRPEDYAYYRNALDRAAGA